MAFPFDIPTAQHDLGSQLSYEFYLKKGYQFGVQVIQNIGPLGLLNYPNIYTGLYEYQKIIYTFINLLLTIRMIFFASHDISSQTGRTVHFVVILLTSLTWGGFLLTGGSYVFLVLSAQYLFSTAKKKTILSESVSIFEIFLMINLSILMMAKTMYSVIVLILVVSLFLLRISEKRFAETFILCSVFFASFIFFWISSAQTLDTLPRYMMSIFLFTDGYNEFAARYEKPLYFWGAMSVWAVILLNIILRLGDLISNKFRLGMILSQTFIFFAMWKHGFVRADGQHMQVFFRPILALFPLILLGYSNELTNTKNKIMRYFRTATYPVKQSPDTCVDSPGCSSPTATHNKVRHDISWVTRYHFGQFFIVITIGFVYSMSIDLPNHTIRVSEGFRYVIVDRAINNISFVLDLRRNMNKQGVKYQESAENVKASIPTIIKTVGQATVDFFGSNPGIPLLGDLNYHPRPMPIAFAATNEHILEMNRKFFVSARTATKFVMLPDATPVMQDNLAFVEILLRYFPVVIENRIILLRRREDQHMADAFKFNDTVIGKKFRLGEWVPIIYKENSFSRMKINGKYSKLGKVVSFLYKPPRNYIDFKFKDDNIVSVNYFMSTGKTNFLVVPFLKDEKLLRFLKDRKVTKDMLPVQFRLVVEKEKQSYYNSDEFSVDYQNSDNFLPMLDWQSSLWAMPPPSTLPPTPVSASSF
ncbi:MAG: hypothetical protein HQL63_00815 [Magnetococcales bacterium]|nr:hypothetical protein [Magnetococcales bacterium]MBF0321412.1 hypothetical protein [Magnetococcales bacterium]